MHPDCGKGLYLEEGLGCNSCREGTVCMSVLHFHLTYLARNVGGFRRGFSSLPLQCSLSMWICVYFAHLQLKGRTPPKSQHKSIHLDTSRHPPQKSHKSDFWPCSKCAYLLKLTWNLKSQETFIAESKHLHKKKVVEQCRKHSTETTSPILDIPIL